MDPTLVVQCLAAITEPNDQIRRAAEAKLKEFDRNAGYGVLLCSIALEESSPEAIRQMASVVLKKYIKEHWSSSGEKYVPPEVNEPDKQIIRQQLPRGLSSPISKIRNPIASVLATIAASDWPAVWPSFINDLAGCLHSNNIHLVSGAIECLDVLGNGGLSDDSLPNFIEIMVPILISMVNSPTFKETIRAGAVSVLNSTVDFLRMTRSKAATKSFTPHVKNWVDCLTKVISQPASSNDYRIKNLALKGLSEAIEENFPKGIDKLLTGTLPFVWAAFTENLPRYVNASIDPVGSPDVISLNDDGREVEVIDTYIASLFDFISTLMGNKKFKAALKPHLNQVFYFILGYIQLTQEDIELWESDPQKLIADMDDEVSTTVRSVGLSLVADVIENHASHAINVIQTALIQRLQESDQMRAQNVNSWWKLREASLYLLNGIAPEIREIGLQNLGFDFSAFIVSVLTFNYNGTGDAYEFLKARAILCAGSFAKYLPIDLAIQFFRLAIETLQSKESSMPLKILCCTAIASFTKALDKSVSKPYVKSILSGIVVILPDANEDTLITLLDTIVIVVKVDKESTIELEAQLTPYLLSIWTHNPDPLVSQDIFDIFQSISQMGVEVLPGLLDRIIPTLLIVLSSPDKLPGLVEGTLDLLTVLFTSCPAPLPTPLVSQVFPPLIKLLMTTEDTSYIKAGACALNIFVHRAHSILSQWIDPASGKSGTHLIIEFAAKLLSPDTEDLVAVYVGSIMSSLITYKAGELGDTMLGMLRAALYRLRTAKLPSLIESLVMVFARLIALGHVTPVLDFLSTTTIPETNENALPFLLRTWTFETENFNKPLVRNLSSLSLIQIFSSQDPRLANITVRGSLVVNPNEKRATRKTKQVETWTEVPLRLKILNILLEEYGFLEAEKNAKLQKMARKQGLLNGLNGNGLAGNGEEEYDEEETVSSDDEGDSEESDTFAPAEDYQDLEHILGGLDSEDEFEDNTIEKEDPFFNVDLSTQIKDFVIRFANSSPQLILQASQQLMEDQKRTLQHILNPQS
eukprot:TRINITY_DN6906_c0_g1_i3.p1 TRINITY_DN6906_c0_g1~~TRINITY_DN6906_c0_g1_i3.p1  ORF type:complete len:1035 (-),score=257.67 TRINITY_DN6906_c0_g1_i3:71-3175(-)